MTARDTEVKHVEDFEVLDAAPSLPATIKSTALAELNKVDAGIKALADKYANKTYDVATTKGMTAAKEARLAIRGPRQRVPHIIKEQKAVLREAAATLDEVGEEIIGRLMSIETPIHEQIKGEEDRKAEEKERAAEAKRVRDAEIQGVIDTIKGRISEAVGKTPEEIAQVIVLARAIECTEDIFGDRMGEAMQVHSEVLEKLGQMQTEAAEWIAQQARMKEAARVDGIKADIQASFSQVTLSAIGKASAAITGMLDAIKAIEITGKRFAEFGEDAYAAKEQAIVQLEGLRDSAVLTENAQGAEAEAKRQAQESARLEREAAEQARRKTEQDEIAAKQAKLAAEQDARAAEQKAQAATLASARAVQIGKAIDNISAYANCCNADSTVAEVSSALDSLRAEPINISTFGGRISAARTALADSLAVLGDFLKAAQEREGVAVIEAAPAGADNTVVVKADPVRAALVAFLALADRSQGVVVPTADSTVTEQFLPWSAFPEVQAARAALAAA